MAMIVQGLKKQLVRALEKREFALIAHRDAEKTVNHLQVAIAAIEQSDQAAKRGCSIKTQKPKRKKRGAIIKGVLDAIRSGKKTRADILAALNGAGIVTTAASVSNALSRLQEKKLIESCPSVRNGWQIVGSSPTNNGGQNEESPPEVQSEGLSQETDAEGALAGQTSVSGERDQSGIALVPFA